MLSFLTGWNCIPEWGQPRTSSVRLITASGHSVFCIEWSDVNDPLTPVMSCLEHQRLILKIGPDLGNGVK